MDVVTELMLPTMKCVFGAIINGRKISLKTICIKKVEFLPLQEDGK